MFHTVDLGHNSAISATETLEPPVGTDEQHDRVAAGESGAPFMTNAPSLQLPSGAATHDIEGTLFGFCVMLHLSMQCELVELASSSLVLLMPGMTIAALMSAGGMHSAAAAMETAVQIGKEVAGAVLPEEHAVGALAEFAEMTHHTPMPLSPHAAHKAGPSPGAHPFVLDHRSLQLQWSWETPAAGSLCGLLPIVHNKDSRLSCSSRCQAGGQAWA